MSALRCRPGDLAWVIRSSAPEFIGHIVCVTKLDNDFPTAWQTDPMKVSIDGAWIVFSDKNLCPIRPGADEDETPTDVIRELTDGVEA
jgi:hypothetical protein